MFYKDYQNDKIDQNYMNKRECHTHEPQSSGFISQISTERNPINKN